MNAKVEVAIADTFWDKLFDLPKAQQKKVRSFVTKFRRDPRSTGINYESINASQDSYRSVRIDQAYRCIVMAPEKGNVYILLWVDHHDDAYAWARRTKVAVHPNTGLLQIFATEEVSADVHREGAPALTGLSNQVVDKTPASLPDPIFNLDDSRLLGLGVPQVMLECVMDLRSTSELESLQTMLPTESYEALYLFHGGCEWGDIWNEYGADAQTEVDVDDIAAAIERPGSKRRFYLIESDAELQAMLAAPLEKWRVYLHPSQRKLVERDWNGPVRVLGGAGTGKTVVAMHRAVWLVRNRLTSDNSGKVLFLTYNTNLAGDIRQQLSTITTPEELAQIETINIDSWVSRYLKSKGYTSRIVFDYELDQIWEDVLDSSEAPPGAHLPASFYKEEWDRIISPKRVKSRVEYLKVSRAGRGVALSRAQRAKIWDIFDEVRGEMQHRGWKTYQDATYDACDLLESDDKALRNAHVIVDETQDMGTEALTLIRKLVKEEKNDLFLVGDGHQRIYRKRAVMSHCGIKIIGRARKLKINYRTTEQIRRFATSVLEGQVIDDLDEGTDTSTAYKSLSVGVEPGLQGFSSEKEEFEWIASKAQDFCSASNGLSKCCVMLRTRKLRDRYAEGLKNAGLEVVVLEQRADNQAVPGIRLATMHRVKGLEFRHVFLAGISCQNIPNRHAIAGSEDKTELRDNELSERALVHVAATRAIENLMVSWVGQSSEYFTLNC